MKYNSLTLRANMIISSWTERLFAENVMRRYFLLGQNLTLDVDGRLLMNIFKIRSESYLIRTDKGRKLSVLIVELIWVMSLRVSILLQKTPDTA